MCKPQHSFDRNALRNTNFKLTDLGLTIRFADGPQQVNHRQPHDRPERFTHVVSTQSERFQG